MLCHFACFLSCVLDVFNSLVATPAHGRLGLSPSLRIRFIQENASLLASYICATTHGPTSNQLLTWALFRGLVTVHIFSFHV